MATLVDLAERYGLNLLLRRYADQDNRWTASFEHCETKESLHSSVLASTYGSGKSPREALNDYAKQIAGKYLVGWALSPTMRREHRMPETIEPWKD